MELIRYVVGRILLLANFLTRPKPVLRGQVEQAKIDAAMSGMSLYQFRACPFCVKVRRHLRRRSLNIELRDARDNIEIKNELVREGGKHRVPRMRIETDAKNIRWLYESDDICAFLDSELDRLKSA